MRDLAPRDAAGACSALAEAKEGRIGGEMVHQAARSDLGERERDAFRTLAAATPEVRTQGIGDFFAGRRRRAPRRHRSGTASGRPATAAPPSGPMGAARAAEPRRPAGTDRSRCAGPPTSRQEAS